MCQKSIKCDNAQKVEVVESNVVRLPGDDKSTSFSAFRPPRSPSPPSFFVLILARELNNSYFNLAQNKLDYTVIGSSL